jgi:hypothetical protein
MPSTSLSSALMRRALARLLAATICVLVLLGAAQASGKVAQPLGQAGAPVSSPTSGGVSATLEQCVTAVSQSERSATFSGEMTAVAGTARMSMRIDVQERMPGEEAFHPVLVPGLSVWRASDPKVKLYKYLKQVTNLSSPASYRALVSFRWTNARGHVIKHAERLTAKCLQPASPPALTTPSPEAPPSSSATTPASA